MQNIYNKSTAWVNQDKVGPRINLERGVKEGDPLGPKMFVAVLSYIMKDLQWQKRSIYRR